MIIDESISQGLRREGYDIIEANDEYVHITWNERAAYFRLEDISRLGNILNAELCSVITTSLIFKWRN